MTLNVLYCLDSNYNTQAFTSITSLLENTTEKFNIYVIHKNRKSFLDNLSERIKFHKNLNNISVFEFDETNIDFPNLRNVHVSEATYYRFFLQKYLPKHVKNILYLDSDIICISNPTFAIQEAFNNLDRSGQIMACKTVYLKERDPEIFKRLNLKNTKYFNAGVMLINFELWQSRNVYKQLLKTIGNKELYFKFWDQDILNIAVDGDYFEVGNELNHEIKLNSNSNTSEINTEESIFLHYSGKHKPWSGRGLFHEKSHFYQYYFSIFSINKSYHITHIRKLLSLKYLIFSFFNFSFFKIKHKKQFLKEYFFTMQGKSS